MPIQLQLKTLLLALLLIITACGQKGPLFMPDQEQPEKTAEAQGS
ncbi:MAG: lipoprotein [Candidatus Thiodiazotropha taylori]|nr:lipoprotein [Candidatus Thiodiazotropha taylori]MCU7944449.1 lipoprotein [Candidatus Thiodiazotropha sp. (ex Cardiolucina cf. quadrata)]MCW4226805.1 lipoprotein [Candidatus Thiodiazotropha endolucinida]MCG7883180.1 lipoprotein [Candidatus Thiodiazotropha taylori]MCG7888367.1 lipoprotein [Candidatus Thiodiazotropha taylori]